MKYRFLDIILSLIGLIIIFPIILIISFVIKLDSRGSIFYVQKRVGRNDVDFDLYKFRTMYVNSDKKGLLTIGKRDIRITRVGYYLRKLKIDELPQFFNVLNGTMSLVGPRPEVRKYVDLYSNDQKSILSVKPGLTDYASIEFINENEILAASPNPELTYINDILPKKIELNLKYINNQSVRMYFVILLKTIMRIFKQE